jgi:phospholipase C
MKSRLAFPRGSRTGRRITGLVLLAAAALVTAMSVGASAGTPSDGLGIQPGKIKHVWLIILENKSYDASVHRA